MSETKGPEYFNRLSGRIEHESVYGEAWLDWAYNRPLGRLTVELAAKRTWFSRWYGWRMSRRASAKKVVPFIRKYGLDIAEMQLPPDHFASFNDFFSRRLKPEARPIDPDPATVVFPADGRHLGFANVAQTDRFYAKGQRMDLAKLLGDRALAGRYEGGSMLISRLCPVDYHRFHYPAEGVPGDTLPINGDLYSVNPVCLRRRLSVLWENKRTLTGLQTERFGQILCLEVGATCVGSIVQTHVPGQYTPKGGEKGYFRFGGSMCITLFEPGAVTLAADLLEHSTAGRELYARMGDVAGRAASA
ncbi:phosphatidylserine decarboxylase [Ruficoccus amylovorans]|uniref:Phosphatidylserine decarboxylase n=1 Tax=Ruficoccus amylovorans TaxID=1804625 RepID=A0A842HB83_9BACT|nr:phosphatidylserine decarboxylase [Ruficoccus amylovorans]MBC2593682.1 phosphatidylserine decarboxylase [Ruficoccus amylovorans]